MNDRLRAATLSNDNYNWPHLVTTASLPKRRIPDPGFHAKRFYYRPRIYRPLRPHDLSPEFIWERSIREQANYPSVSPGELKNGKNGNCWKRLTKIVVWLGVCMVIVFFFFSSRVLRVWMKLWERSGWIL